MRDITTTALYALGLLIFALDPALGQIQSGNGLISGWNGIGRGTPKCMDRDRDGYGTGPLAHFLTTSSGSVGSGTNTLALTTTSATFTGTINSTNQITFPTGTFAGSYDFQTGEAISGTGIPSGTIILNPSTLNSQLTISNAATTSGTFTFTVTIVAGTVLTVGVGGVQERVPVTSVSGNNITAPFAYAHSSGEMVKTQGCAGPDADDYDQLRHTSAQILALYGTIPAFMAKHGNDLAIDNPIPSDSATAAAIRASYTSPHAVWYVAPAASGGSNSNSGTVGSPLLNEDGLISKGYTTSDMVIARQGWSNDGASQAFDPANGTSSLYSIVISYPGERAVFDGLNGTAANIAMVASTGVSHDYVIFDGITIQDGAQASGGTIDGTGSVNTHHILFAGIDGGNGGTGISSLDFFNGMQYMTVQDSVLHDNDCHGGGCQHGIYWGCRDVACSNIMYRRDIAYGNDSNGFTFNGRCTSCVFNQLVAYSNGISGLTLEMGVKNSTITDLLAFNNTNDGLTIFNYPGDCVAQGGTGNICPYDQTGNLAENITIYQTGNANVANANNSAGSGCPSGIGYCGQGGLSIANSTSPLTGNLGSNTFRNVFVSSYGYVNHYPPIIYEDTTAHCGSSCLAWLSSSTFNNITGYQTDGNSSGTGIFGVGPGSFGFVPYTCSAATSLTTLTNCSVTDPLFAKEGISLWNSEMSYDFRLSATSPLIGAGTATGAPTYDLTGIPFAGTPSIGTLEVAPNFIWTNYPGQTSLSVAPPVGGGQYSATATASGGTATLTLSGTYYSAHGNQAVANQNVIVTGCSVSAYNSASVAITAFTSNTIQYTVAGSPGSATGCTVGMSVDGSGNPYGYPSLNPRVFTAWGSGVLASNGCLYFSGGGHSDYGGNEIYCFNVNTNTMSLATTPSVITLAQWNASPTFYKNNDGQWASRHIFGGWSYVPGVNIIHEIGGSPYGNNGTGQFGDSWKFDPSGATWTQLDPVNCPTTCGAAPGRYINLFGNGAPSGNGPSSFAAYDPNTQAVWVIPGALSGALMKYTPCTGSNPSVCNSYLWAANITFSNCGTTTTCSMTFVDDVNKNFWVFGGGYAYYWNIDGSTIVEHQPTIDSSCNAVLNAAGPGIAWDHADVLARMYVGTGNDQTIYEFNPATRSCTTDKYGGATPPASSNVSGTFGRFQYSSSLNEWIWIGDYNTAPSILAAQTGCHITPTSLPSGVLATPYSQTLTNIGCSSSTWSLSGSLPTGLSGCSSGSGATCTISGTPTQTGTFGFTVSYGTASNPYNISITPGSSQLFLPTMIKP